MPAEIPKHLAEVSTHYFGVVTKFSRGDQVYVPSRLVPSERASAFALTLARVTAISEPSESRRDSRSVHVDIEGPDGHDLRVSSKLLHAGDLGIAIVRIGDLATETALLDPLAKSVLQYLRLLLNDDVVTLTSVRTTAELGELWARAADATSHVVLIGHGNPDSLRFIGSPAPVSGRQLGAMLVEAAPTTRPKRFLSLACLTGHGDFARPFSQSRVCADLFAPLQSVHGASASLYCQAFFANHLLGGKGHIASHRAAKRAVGTGVSFWHWKDGQQKDRRVANLSV